MTTYLLHELLRLGQIGVNKLVVHEEETETDEIKNEVDAMTHTDGLLVRLPEGRHRRIFVTDLAQILALAQPCLTHFALA